MALRLNDLQPQDMWNDETTWEEVTAAMDPPMPKAWIRGLKGTHSDDASYIYPTPADFWRKYWKPHGINDWKVMRSHLWMMRSHLWMILSYVTFDDPECDYGKKCYVGGPDTDIRIGQIIALLAGLDTDTDLSSIPSCTVSSPFDRTRTEQRLETIDYNTTKADGDIQALQERLSSVRQRTTNLEKRDERKRHQQGKGQERQRLKELGEMLAASRTNFHKNMAEFSRQQRKKEEEAKRNAEALRRVEPVLSVVMMIPELMDGEIHSMIKVPWSQVQAKDGKAIFEFEGINYELQWNKFNSTSYTGHAMESD